MTWCGCIPDLKVADAPPHVDQAVALIAKELEASGLVLDTTQLGIVWVDGDCLSYYSIDTDHWTIREHCVQGLAPDCGFLIVVKKETLAMSALTHEMAHCLLYQAYGQWDDVEHRRREVWDLVPGIKQRLAEAGL